MTGRERFFVAAAAGEGFRALHGVNGWQLPYSSEFYDLTVLIELARLIV